MDVNEVRNKFNLIQDFDTELKIESCQRNHQLAGTLDHNWQSVHSKQLRLQEDHQFFWTPYSTHCPQETSVGNRQVQHGPHRQPPPKLELTTEDTCLQEIQGLPKLVRQLVHKAESLSCGEATCSGMGYYLIGPLLSASTRRTYQVKQPKTGTKRGREPHCTLHYCCL